jgi:hypothetical protein
MKEDHCYERIKTAFIALGLSSAAQLLSLSHCPQECLSSLTYQGGGAATTPTLYWAGGKRKGDDTNPDSVYFIIQSRIVIHYFG